MLADYSDDEIEIVLAHELAHHVHGDIWKGIAFESALVVGGFFLAARLLAASIGPLGLRARDPAGLPLLLLAAGAVSVVMLPAAYALSRTFERSADRFALEPTRNPGAFVTAMRRLAAQNLAEERPSRLIQWLFYSHPAVGSGSPPRRPQAADVMPSAGLQTRLIQPPDWIRPPFAFAFNFAPRDAMVLAAVCLGVKATVFMASWLGQTRRALNPDCCAA